MPENSPKRKILSASRFIGLMFWTLHRFIGRLFSRIKKFCKTHPRVFLALILFCIFVMAFAIYADYAVSKFSKDIYTDVSEMPNFEVGLLLGTSKYAGREKHFNLYYLYRMRAAAELYKEGKIKKIIASGDGSTFTDCEPVQMRDDLITLGVPEEDIVLDYAGFRTLDSVLRCQKVFGVSEFLVISQDFHCRRALFIAQGHGLNAKAFAARDVYQKKTLMRQSIREFLARSAAMIDVYWINRNAKFYGEPIPVLTDKVNPIDSIE